MRSAASIIALSAPLLASAAPLYSRTASANDILVFTFANVLEQLESNFYQAAIAKFQTSDFLAAGYVNADVAVEQLQQIASDEATHESALASAITSFGAQPLSTCKFNFDSVLTDVATTMTVARVVELVGVSAYLGAAGLLDDVRLLTTAASVLTNEARHQTILNVLNGGASIPAAFDIAFSPQQVLSIAGSFISGCDLGVTPTASLAVTNTGNLGAGTLLTFKSDAIDAAAKQTLFCNMLTGGATTAISLAIDQCIVPDGITGPVAVIITNSSQPLLSSDLVDQEQDIITAGPAYIFVDLGVKEQQFAQLILNSNSTLNKDLTGLGDVQAQSCPDGSSACTSVSSDTTTTISNEQASGAANAGSAPSTTDTGSTSTSTDTLPAAATATSTPVLASTQTFAGSITVEMPSSSASTAVGSAGSATSTAVPAGGAAGADSTAIIPAVPSASSSSSAAATTSAAGGIVVAAPSASSSSSSSATTSAAGDIVAEVPSSSSTTASTSAAGGIVAVVPRASARA